MKTPLICSLIASAIVGVSVFAAVSSDGKTPEDPVFTAEERTALERRLGAVEESQKEILDRHDSRQRRSAPRETESLGHAQEGRLD